MNVVDQLLLPIGFVVLAALGGVVAHWIAGRRRDDRDLGDFWSRIVLRACLVLAFPVLLSGATKLFPPYWQTGRHLHFDLTGVFGWSIALCYVLALLLPFVVWAALLLYGVGETPGGRDSGRWLAGAIGFENSRRWVLVWCVPLAVILGTTMDDLGGGAGAYPAAAWGTVAVLLLALIGVALSTGEARVRAKAPVPRPGDAKPELRPWPEALTARGLQLRHLATWPQTEGHRTLRQPGARNLLERLRLRGAHGVAPQLIEAIHDLLGSTADDSRSRLVFAPDDCGQVEVVAMAAELLDQRFHAATLVVTATGAEALADELRRWVSPGRQVMTVGATGEIRGDALIVVVDAQVLSDRLLPELKNPMLLKRFGLIVWWHLEAYTGVLAANLWAISRRLHRLLEAMGRHDVLTLAFMRNTPHGGAQLGAFVRRLLPHPLPPGSEVQVQSHFPRPVHLHVLESHDAYFARGEGRGIQERQRHLALVAARISVEERWPTRLQRPADIPESEAMAFLQMQVGEAKLIEALQPYTSSAAACVRKLEEGEVLSVAEIIGQGGRAAGDGLPHHVGVTLPSNPYVAHLLSTLHPNGNGAFAASRRLVPAAPPPSVVRRHILLALEELPDTRTGLLKNFMWNEEIIRTTLEEIDRDAQLTRGEVRFLDERNELKREHEYKSQRPPSGERRPLDTVGTRLVDVRDVSAGLERGEGVTMRVDPERLPIQAYPHRVFVHRGQRYRVRDWSSAPNAQQKAWVECDREGVHSATWRIRLVSVFGIHPTGAPVGIGHKNKLMVRLSASLRYEEEVSGAINLASDLTHRTLVQPQRLMLSRPVVTSFETRALIIRFPEQQESIALTSLAQTLRHLLPVHLGVDEDAIEVVPLNGTSIERQPTYGLAIVDLYPGGIGVVDAIGDDASFLLHLLGQGKEWLAACRCGNDQGCEHCLRSPAADAANISQRPMRAAALGLLRQVV